MIQIKVSLLHPMTGDEMMYIKRDIKDLRKDDIVLHIWKHLLKNAKSIRTFLRRVAGGRIKTEIFDFGMSPKSPRFRVEVNHGKESI